MKRRSLAAVVMSLLLLSARADEPRRDRFGDPLPPGAVARLGTVNAHPNASAVHFTADGRTVVTTGKGVVRHWDAESGRVRRVIVRPFENEEVWQIISADGRIAATAFANRVEIHDLEHDKRLHRVEIARLKELDQTPADLTLFGISPEGDLVFLRLRDSEDTIVIRDGKIESWTGLPPGFGAPFFSDDGKHVAVWSQHEGKMGVAVRRTAPGAEPQKIDFPGYLLAVAPDGSTLFGHNTGMVFVAKTGLPAAGWDLKLSGESQAACFSRDGRLLAVATDRELSLWDAAAKRLVWKSPIGAKALAFSLDGERLAGIDHLLRLWDVKTGKALDRDFGPPASHFLSTPFPNRYVVTASAVSGRLHVWDWVAGTVRFTAEADGYPALAWLSADGGQLHAYRQFRLTTWDVVTGKLLRQVDPTPSSLLVAPPRPTPDGRFLHMLIGKEGERDTHTECTLLCWDVSAAKVVERHRIKLPEFRHAEFATDAWGVYSTTNLEVPGRITDARTGRPWLAATWTPPAQTKVFNRPVVSMNGRAVAFQLYCGDVDPPIHETVVLDSATGKPLLRVPAAARHSGSATDYSGEPKALSPDGRWLVVAHHFGVELWDIVQQKNVPFHPPYPTPDSREGTSQCDMLAFVSNGHLIARYDDANILVWEMPPAARQAPEVLLRATTWNELSDEDPRVALRAIWALKNEPQAGLDLLRRLKPAGPADEKAIAALYADLASNNFAVRDGATKHLREYGHAAGPFLARTQSMNTEQKRRTQQLLDALAKGGPLSSDERRTAHAVHAAELIGGDAGRALLADWAKGDESGLLTHEAKAALERLR